MDDERNRVQVSISDLIRSHQLSNPSGISGPATESVCAFGRSLERKSAASLFKASSSRGGCRAEDEAEGRSFKD